MYPIQRISRSEFVPIRGLNYHVRVWGNPTHPTKQADQPVWVMLHGWMDVSASYQFVVDALEADHWVIAPDWRGYGLTDAGGADNFWFPDYLADLDFLLDHYAPSHPVNLIGHSMGGNIAMLYAGTRPERVRRLINLEGFGMPATQPSEAPARYARWMDELKALHRGEMAMRGYNSLDEVAQRLMKTNPRLGRDDAGRDKAAWLAQHWAAKDAQGQWRVQGDAAHKIVNANLYQAPEVQEIYQCIRCPTLCVDASDNQIDAWWHGKYTLAEYHQRIQAVAQLSQARIEDAAHMLHHDQPQQLARVMESFLA